MLHEEFDVIVVGAGVMGSSSAYAAAKQGLRTLLLEQFPLPHTRGSSHGHSRTTRKLYHTPYYVNMMCDTFPMWETLEKEAGASIYSKCGVLTMFSKGDKTTYDNHYQSISGSGVSFKTYSGENLQGRFPMLEFRSDYDGIFEPDGGVLKADVALRSFQKIFTELGGKIRDAEPVTQIVPGQLVTVVTSKGQYQARRVILTVGSWINHVLEPLDLKLPVKVLRTKLLYFRQRDRSYTIESGYPCFSAASAENFFFSTPSQEYPDLVKIGLHGGQEIRSPDSRDLNTESYSQDSQLVENFVRNHMPKLEPKPSLTEVCIYSMTPDEDFILDTHPLHKNIVIGAGFSGHGFKLAPLVGSILVDLATGQRPTKTNIKPFQLNRFETHPSKL